MSNAGWATPENIEHFHSQGFLKLPSSENLIPRYLVQSARHYARNVLPHPRPDKRGWSQYNGNEEVGPGELRKVDAPELKNLLTHNLKAGIGEIFKGRSWSPERSSWQIAYQFPQGRHPVRAPDFHVDGYSKDDEFHRQSLLIGILLHKLGDDAGNFTLFPGSHKTVEKRFADKDGETGTSRGKRLAAISQDWGEPPGSPSVTGLPGTVVILDPLTVHGTIENATRKTRIMAFIRAFHSDDSSNCVNHREIGLTLASILALPTA